MRGQTYYATGQGLRVAYSGSLVTEECCACGIPFAMPEEFRKAMVDDKKSFHCPNGHSQHYTTSEADRLRKQLEQERAALNSAYDRLNAEKRSHAATKGQLTRIKKGVCPYCHRNFSAVKRHIDRMHPDEAAHSDHAGSLPE